MKTINFTFKGQEITVSACNGHVWLELEGEISTPLAMRHCEEGGRYAYLVSSDGEVRIYENGEIYWAD